jgi:hypothetical protein
MKTKLLGVGFVLFLTATHGWAATNLFFSPAQVAVSVVSNINAVTVQSGDYRFTYSSDGYWSAYAGGPPTGRFFSVGWPEGVQAQAITAGPLLGSGANIKILVPANTDSDSFNDTISDVFGATASGPAAISIIGSVTSRVTALDLNTPGSVNASFTGVPWYSYECQRSTNVTFTGTLRTWPVQAWSDGSILVSDDFADAGGQPPQAFYRLLCVP